MNKIWIITLREYLTRVKKRSFIIMTLLGPLLLAGFYGGIAWITMNKNVGASEKQIVIVDPSNKYQSSLNQPENITFLFKQEFSEEDLINSESVDGYIITQETESNDVELIYKSKENLSVSENGKIRSAFNSKFKNDKLNELGISQSTLDSLKTNISITEFKIDKSGNSVSSSIEINTILGMILAILIYFFIFLYGVQVMKGVIEEKTTRIVELIISTVKTISINDG